MNDSLNGKLIQSIELALARPRIRNLLLGLTLGLMAINLWIALRSQRPMDHLELSAIHIPKETWGSVPDFDRHFVARSLVQWNDSFEQVGLPLYRVRIDDPQALERDRLEQLREKLAYSWWTARWTTVSSSALDQIDRLALRALVRVTLNWIGKGTRHSPTSMDAPYALVDILGGAAKQSDFASELAPNQMAVIDWLQAVFELAFEETKGTRTVLWARRDFVRRFKIIRDALETLKLTRNPNHFVQMLGIEARDVRFAEIEWNLAADRRGLPTSWPVRKVRVCSVNVPTVDQLNRARQSHQAEVLEWARDCRQNQKGLLIAAEPFKKALEMGWVYGGDPLTHIQRRRPDLIGNPLDQDSWRRAPVPLAVVDL